MTDVLEFTDISQEVRGAMNGGRLKLNKQGVFFKNKKTGKVEQVHSEDLIETNWLRVAKGHELKLRLQNGSIFKFDGFNESDQDKLTEFIKNSYNLSLDEVDLAVKGRNWGAAKFNGSELAFEVDKKPAFHIPLGNVSHSTTTKNEVILEFHQNDDTEVSLMEMRFYVPPTEADANAAEVFHENIVAKADIIQATGESIASLEQIPCLTPRGRYDIKIFPTFLQLHGKTFDYKIPFTTVLRLFLLPHKDNRQMYFVISLDPPIVQGQTRYHFLILSFNKEEDLSLDLNLTDEEIEEKYKGKLQKHMTGPSFEIVSRLMKSLSARKITIPGSFTGRSGTQTVSCSYKSNSGFLYPLERGFIYVHKPPIHIRFEEIACVNFARGTGSSRYFDFEIETRNGNVFVFSSIEKDEYSPLFDFVSNKKLRVKNRGGNIKDGKSVNYEEMVDSDDDEDTHDAYLEQMKAEGRERDDVGEPDEDYIADLDSDASDSDFNPGDSGSDVAEEYDSNPSTSDSGSGSGSESSEAEEGELKRKKHRDSKPKKKAKTVTEKPRKKRKDKKDKDPNMPKRPNSAYMIWLNEHREGIKEKYPGIVVTEVSKKAGEMWNKLEDKTEWQEKAAKVKEVYMQDMAEYKEKLKEEGGSSVQKKAASSKKKKGKGKSKSSDSASSPSKKISSAGSGGNYKSKEYISDSSSSVGDDEDDEEEDAKSEASEEAASTPPSSEGEKEASGGSDNEEEEEEKEGEGEVEEDEEEEEEEKEEEKEEEEEEEKEEEKEEEEEEEEEEVDDDDDD